MYPSGSANSGGSGIPGSSGSPNSSSNATLQRQYQRQQRGMGTAASTLQRSWMMVYNPWQQQRQRPQYAMVQPQRLSYVSASSASSSSSFSPFKSFSNSKSSSPSNYSRYPSATKPYANTSSNANGGVKKVRSSVVVIFIGLIVLGTVVLEGHYTLSNSSANAQAANRQQRRSSQQSRNHISPVIVATSSTTSTSSSSTVTSTSRTSRTAVAAQTTGSPSPPAARPPPPAPTTTLRPTIRQDAVSSDTQQRVVVVPDTKGDGVYTNDGSSPTVSSHNIPSSDLLLQSYIEFHEQHVAEQDMSSRQRSSRRRHGHGLEVVHRAKVNMNDTSNASSYTYTPSLTYRCNGQTCGGIGDRLQGIVQTFFMAVCTNRIFTIDWHEHSSYGRGRSRSQNNGDGSEEDHDEATGLLRYLQPRHVHWEAVDKYNDLSPVPDAAVVAPNDSTREKSTTEASSQSFSEEPDIVHAMDNRNNTLLIEPHVMLPSHKNIILYTNLWMGDAFVQGQCWQNYSRQSLAFSLATATDAYRSAFDTLFQWSPDVQEAASVLRHRAQLSPATAAAAPNMPFIAMHIRTGLLRDDAVVAASSSVQQRRHADSTEWSLFLQCAHRIHQHLREHWCPDKTARVVDDTAQQKPPWMDIYLASDHRAVKEQLLLQDPTIKTILDLDLHHVDSKEQHQQQNDHSSSDRVDDGAMTAWSELNLLQDAVCLVQSNSKYSAVAGAISSSRCAVRYDECSDQAVALAVSSIPSPYRVESSRLVDCG